MWVSSLLPYNKPYLSSNGENPPFYTIFLICIEIQIHVDPFWNGSPDEYWEYGFQILIKENQTGVEWFKKSEISSWKSIDHFVRGLMALTWDWKSSIKVFIAICDFKISGKKFP